MANIGKPPCDEGVIRTIRAPAPCTPASGPWVLAATILGSAMAFIDGTVTNVALPQIQDRLGATAVDAQWIVEAYSLFLAALILVGGSLGDHFGRRRIFLSAHLTGSQTSGGPSSMSEIQGVARFKFHEGKVEEFKRLSAQVMDIVRAKDTGTLQYEIYFNDDQSECVVYERYRGSEAVIEHATHVGDLMKAIFATGSVSSQLLLGEPSAELTAMTAGSGVSLFRPFLSM